MNSLTGSVTLCSLIRSLMRCHGPWISFPNQGTASPLLHGLSPTVTAAPPGPMHPVIPTAFRPRDNLTQPLPSPRHGGFSRQLKCEPTSGCDGENETPVDIAITITVERVVRYFPDSWGETITDDSLCPSGRRGPPTPSWFSYGLDSTSCVFLRSNLYSPVVARTIYDQYTVVRFNARHHPVALRDLDQVAKSLSSVAHIMQLNNGRWELLVWKGCITELKGNLCQRYPGSFLEVDQYPWDPDPEDVEYFGLVRARKLCHEWFRGRALRAIHGERYTIGPYYGYILYCVLPYIGEMKGGTARCRL